MKRIEMRLWTGAAALVLALAVACGKPVPVQELSDARAGIAAASALNAGTHSPEDFNAARQALLAAHQQLADDKPADAKTKAEEALKSALAARFTSAPKFVAAEKSKTDRAINDADEAYAEVLSKDDFEAATKLRDDGDALAKGAETASGAAGDDQAKKMAAVEQYEAAAMKYAAAQDAALRAKNKSLAQKDDLLDSLSGVETLLRRAEQYRAAELAPEEYNAAKREIDQARTDITDGRLKKGNGHILKAEELSRATLNAVLEKHAKEKKEEATRVVAAAEKSFQDSGADKETDPKIREQSGKIQEMLSAAQEAVKSAGKNYDGARYEPSIKDSEEAIRLAGIAREQLAALEQQIAIVVKNRGGKVGPDTKTATNLKGWKKYVVQKKKPADCLWRIAKSKRQYGNPWLWKNIYRANKDKISDPDLIYPGQVLWIPPKNYRGGPPKVSGEVRPDKKAEEKTEPETKPRENIE